MKILLPLIGFLFLQSSVYSQDIFSYSRNGETEKVLECISQKADTVNALNEHGFTPLIIAVYRNQSEVAKILLKNGAEPDYNSQEGSALVAVCYKGNLELAELLLEYGADINATGANGVTSLIFAAQSRNVELVKLLLDHNAKASIKDTSGNTAFDYAKNSENKVLIELLSE